MNIRATFVMEQHLGHRSYYQNLRRFVDPDSQVAANWVQVTYTGQGAFGVRWPFLPETVRGALNGRRQVLDGLRRQPYDLALFNTQVPAVLGGRIVQRRPYILCTDITPRQYDRLGEHYGHHPDHSGPVSLHKHQVNRRVFQGAARILPWSSWAGSSLIEDYGVDPARIQVLPPGVDTGQWRPAGSAAGGPLRILFVGGDFYRKGGDTLLEAYRRLPPGDAEVILVTRSSVPFERGVTAYNHLQPNTAELVELYRSCHVFVLPTKAEAFGIAAVEASAVGLPVVATNVGGLADIIAEGETGFLVQPGDARALAARLQLLVDDPGLRQRLGRAARERAEERFDARKNAARLVEILVETICERDSR